MELCGRQKVVQRKMVLLGDGACGKTSALNVDSPDSFENVATKWIDEIRENCPGVKLVLTALKCDLRKDEELNDNPNAITFEQGLAKAKEIGAVKYLECSAVQNRGIRETFYEAAKVALDVKPAGSSGSKGQCIIL
ncbi:hypothetical protein CNMCM8980_007836 [Aspergillus fumigatiaffinis]|uniref:Rho GTPase Rho3 n=1 Tax=Aspergillus fumigatiaffinis TaxID=340414 RepID=A0A8H4MAG6_9EURO|nr:hypothetical protein CNMCM6805_007875 [Aspergillus fumigatiaffinis]KAF4247027.1 hypothetical protein CNMCM8980_007836 [Aspergillus fumigatiaffinis]